MLPSVLFHGSAFAFKRIDLTKCRGRKDFDRGFYMAFSVEQAIGMMHKKFRETVSRRRDRSFGDLKESLYRIELDVELLTSLRVKEFAAADKEWHVMACDSLTQDAAYCKVFKSELFKLVSDPDTRLFLEPNEELARLYDVEVHDGVEALYASL